MGYRFLFTLSFGLVVDSFLVSHCCTRSGESWQISFVDSRSRFLDLVRRLSISISPGADHVQGFSKFLEAPGK